MVPATCPICADDMETAASSAAELRTPKAEVLAIGSELTSGQCLDTNSPWLSRKLAEIGISVRWHTTVGDDLNDNLQAFRIASERADLVVSTGGLGPTLDDLTRDVLAKVANVPLELHEPSLSAIERMFAQRGRVMPEANRVQAYCPRGGIMLPNEHGTAPGIWLETPKTVFVALPGPPREMQPMWEHEVVPRLRQRFGPTGVTIHRRINTFGWGESQVEEKVRDLTRRGHVPEVGITAHEAVVSLRITARGSNTEEAWKQIEPIEKVIRERLGTIVFGVDEEDLHDVVARMLHDRRMTIATAESLTGGLVAQMLSRVPGVSDNLRGGVVAYTNEVKRDWLGVPQELLDRYGAVSSQVAEAMAVGCRTRFGTDLAVSTTGLAGPGGGTPEKPVGLVYAAVAWEGGVRSSSFLWGTERTQIQGRAARMALNLARLYLASQLP
ncbi:MAG: competence/damage-inducible protein A [Gemmatales bacterium]|nr:competence/damage-inducible protein A [Gemmatales bacterium]MDW8386278.1 competence/damage-inducible protein A [Gemmatales bacterium]